MRISLRPGTVLHLKSCNQIQQIYTIESLAKNGEKGSSCLCYIALKKDGKHLSRVLLKEFYPNIFLFNGTVSRNKDQSLAIDYADDDILIAAAENFRRGVEYLRKFAADDKLSSFLCCDKDIDILYGNGTMYYENTLYQPSCSWNDIPASIEIDDILQTAIETNHFLQIFHSKDMAYVDLKPDDILLPPTIDGEPDCAHPLFYDLNSAKKINQEYALTEITSTEAYRPPEFEGTTETTEINHYTENYTFSMVLEERVEPKLETIPPETSDRLQTLLTNLRSRKNVLAENEVDLKLKEIRDAIRDHEFLHKQDELKKAETGFHLLHISSMLITGTLIFCMLAVSFILCFSPNMLQKYSYFSNTAIASALLISVVILTVLKIINSKIAAKMANIAVACEYYQKPIRTDQYNTFRKMGRKNTTYQDESQSNLDRQKLRRILWLVLGISVLISLLLSIYLQSFPIFLSLTFAATIIFMFADCIPSHNRFFSYYAEALTESPTIKSARDGRALYYMDEYELCGRDPETAFQTGGQFYTERNLNLFLLRSMILTQCYHDSSPTDLRVLKSKNTFMYCRKSAAKERFTSPLPNLHYKPTQIRQIYKMAFDRLKNVHLVINLSVLLAAVVAALLVLMTNTGVLDTYFCLPEYLKRPISLLLLLAVSIASFYQLAYSSAEEMTIADLSYKSRFVVTDALNDELAKDIAAGWITPVDIARGTYQYSGEITTEKKNLVSRLNPLYHRPIFQHREVANRKRLAITIWLSFGIIFSFVVWYLQIYWMFPVLLIGTTSIHILLRKYWLPAFGRKQLIEDIIRLEAQI